MCGMICPKLPWFIATPKKIEKRFQDGIDEILWDFRHIPYMSIIFHIFHQVFNFSVSFGRVLYHAIPKLIPKPGSFTMLQSCQEDNKPEPARRLGSSGGAPGAGGGGNWICCKSIGLDTHTVTIVMYVCMYIYNYIYIYMHNVYIYICTMCIYIYIVDLNHLHPSLYIWIDDHKYMWMNLK